jgi:hypothetical protein
MGRSMAEVLYDNFKITGKKGIHVIRLPPLQHYGAMARQNFDNQS